MDVGAGFRGAPVLGKGTPPRREHVSALQEKKLAERKTKKKGKQGQEESSMLRKLRVSLNGEMWSCIAANEQRCWKKKTLFN